MPDDMIDYLVEHFGQNNPDGYSSVLFEPLHAAATRVDATRTAFAFRHARFNISAKALWADPGMDEEQVTWARAVRDRLRPLSTVGYLNYATDDTAETVEGAHGAQILARLRAAKRTWDPDNLFQHNHNIPPPAAWRDAAVCRKGSWSGDVHSPRSLHMDAASELVPRFRRPTDRRIAGPCLVTVGDFIGPGVGLPPGPLAGRCAGALHYRAAPAMNAATM